MPQCENLMLGIQKIPSTPVKTYTQISPSNRNTPPMQIPKICIDLAPTMIGESNGKIIKPSTTNTSQPKNATELPNNVNTIFAKDEEKVADLSLRRELKLTTLVLICFVLAIVIPLSMIVVGAVYVRNCSQEKMIPVFLIVCGSAFLSSLYGLRKLAARRKTEFDWTCYKITFWICVWLQCGWFIAGCFWIYRSYEPTYIQRDEEPYCNRTLYQYAFWLVNSIMVILSIFIGSFIAFLLCGKLNMPKGQTSV